MVIAIGAQPEQSATWRLDVMAAIENMLLAATSMGLGTGVLANPDSTLWRSAEDLLTEALHIPRQRGLRIPVLVTVGHPVESPQPHTREERFDQTKVHYGAWEERKLGGEA